jgi:hypothetical protein
LRTDGSGRVAKKVGVGLVGCLLAFTLGCSADDIMGPGSSAVPETGSAETTTFALLPDPCGVVDCTVEGEGGSEGTSSLVSASDGGVVSWGRFRLEIPAGALSEDTVIEISRPDPGFVMCELKPHGLQFNEPVTLQIDYSGTAAEADEASMPAFGVYWFDEATNEWTMVGDDIDEGADKMQAELAHFSKYGSGMEPGTEEDPSKYSSGMEP